MAGHSQFKNIMYRKGAQDAKRAKVFSKAIRELTVAAKAEPDPAANAKLRTAITAAKAVNMPKDTMDRAIKRGAGGGDDTNYDEIRYEGYGPGGVAIIVEALTDNRNRTVAEVRTAFTKHGGSLGETNRVSFMFDRVGSIFYPVGAASADDMFEAALEVGADDVDSTETGHEIIDLGTHNTKSVDYPDYAEVVGMTILEKRADRGIVICGSGVGASVAANKLPGIRAGLCHDTYSAHQGVEHDDMNVLVLGARVVGLEMARELIRTFLGARFSGEERHKRRLKKIHILETRYRP